MNLLEAVEVWKEDWPDEDQGDHEQATAANAKMITSRRLLGDVPSEAKDWREATLSQLLPILSSLEEESRGSDGSGGGSSCAASAVPSYLQPFLPSNLPEELLVQLRLVEHLWTISERLHIHPPGHRDQNLPSAVRQSGSSDTVTKHAQDSSAVLRPASPANSSPTAVSPAPGYTPGSADKTQLDPRPHRSAQLDGRIGSHNESLIRYSREGSSMPFPHTPPDGSLFSLNLGFLGNWIRFTFVIGPDPEKRDKGSSGAAGGRSGAPVRKGETARRTPGYRSGAGGWSSKSALSWVLGAVLVAVIAALVGLVVPALGSSVESQANVA